MGYFFDVIIYKVLIFNKGLKVFVFLLVILYFLVLVLVIKLFNYVFIY